jgi:DNA-binding beta-propeller fold protein YncE
MELHRLETRLAAAEREIEALKKTHRGAARRGALAWGACGLAVAAALFAGARPAITQEEGMTVKAPFRVVTPAGKPVVTINADNEGPFIRLFNATDGTSMLLWADKDGGNIAVKNTAGKNIGELISRSDGAGGNFRVLDKEGRNMVSMFARSDGSGGNLAVYNAAGKSVFAAFARSDNKGGDLGLYDKDGKNVAAMFARNEGGGILQIYDGDAKVIYKQP